MADRPAGSAGRRSAPRVDTFVRDGLPPRDLWPQMNLTAVTAMGYPDRLNAAAELLDVWISRGQGNRVVLRHASATWTYDQLYETANQIAHVLTDGCGVVPGSRVLLRGPNHPMLVACWFAVLKAGAIAVTTMPLLRTRELREICEKADVSLALCDARFSTDLESAFALRRGSRLILFNGDPTSPASLESLMSSRLSRFDNVATASDEPAIIAFTSGTTGRSKGTVHVHRDLLAVADTYGRLVLEPRPSDIFIGSPPIAFTYGLGGLVLFPMRVGASTALIEQATAQNLLAGIQEFGATIVISSPTGYRAMLANAGDFDLSSLRRCVSAGETLPAATFNAWLDATGIRLMDGIGSTEMLHMFIGSTPDEAKSGSTGKVVPGYRAIVVDDNGDPVPAGAVGRLAVQGPTGCRYLDDLDNQRKYVQNGWNLTGDAYRVDADGYFWYQARTDDMIISSGYNISGPEIENVLLSHGAVAECAVVGTPDEARGQLVKAFIVPHAGHSGSDELAKELQDFVKRELAPYKYPRAVEFVTTLPRTLTGKIQRFRLRDDAAPATAASSPAAISADPVSSSPAELPAIASSSPLEVHEPSGWARPIGYSNVVSGTGRIVCVSGQIGCDPTTGKITSTNFVSQVHQALENVVAALAAAGAKPNQIARMTWYITDRDAYMTSRRQIGEAYREIIGRHFPAMSAVVVSGLVDADARVEIEATAIVE